MKFLLSGIGCALAVTVLGAGPSPQLQRELQARYDVLTRAFVSGRLSPMGDILADDYVLTKDDGTSYSRAQIMKGYADQRKILHSIVWPERILRVTSQGRQILVVTDAGWTAKTGGGKTPESTLALEARSHDVWVHTRKGWQIKSSMISNPVFRVNGKRMKG